MKEGGQVRDEDRNCYSSCCAHVRTKWPVALLIISFTFLFLIVLFKWVALERIINYKIAEQVRLVPESSTWNKWTNITVPIFLKFYLFNVTNPLEVMQGSKPRLKETGPYVYEEKRIKTVLGIDVERDTVAYRQRITYYFRPDLSGGSEKDRIILINVPFVSVAKLARQMTNLTFAYGVADRSLRQRGERLFTFNTVREYLFDGWSVESYISFLSNPLLQLVGGVNIPEAFAGGKFGFYKGKNNTDDGEMVVRTGITNPKEFGRIMSWNGQTKLSHWSGSCNLINGTDGSILPPFITKDEILRFFIPDLCRSLLMVYGNETEFKGVKAYRFILPDPKPIFASEDFCFCPKDTKFECYKTGVFSLSPCRESAPITVSAPHFYQAWEPYQNSVEGLHANPKDHDTFLDVEPKTGLVLRGVKRLQFNIKVEPNPHMPTFARVRTALFPVMWVEEAAEISDDILADIRSQLYDSLDMAERVSLGGLLGCSVLILLGIIGCFIVTCKQNTYVKSSVYSGTLTHNGSTISKEALARTESNSSSGTTKTQSTMTSINKGTMTDSKNGTVKNRGTLFEPYAYIPSSKAMEEKVSKI